MESTEGIKIGRNCKFVCLFRLHVSFRKISYLVGSSAKSASDWTIGIQNKMLMPDPHTETGSQDVVVINATESLVGLHDVTALRFILRQPSPNWKTFNVDEIAVSTVLEFISHKVRSKRFENKPFFPGSLIELFEKLD